MATSCKLTRRETATDGDEPRIVEQDGNVVRIVAGEIEVIAEMMRESNELVFDRLSIDGAGPGSVGLARLRELARAFAKSQGVAQIRISGTTRNDRGEPWQSSA